MPNNIKLLTIQQAANQLGVTVTQFLKCVDSKPPTVDNRGKQRVIIGACLSHDNSRGKDIIYHLSKNDIKKFILSEKYILKIDTRKDNFYDEYFEHDKGYTPAPERLPKKIAADKKEYLYDITLNGLNIPEGEFNRLKKEIKKDEITQTGDLTFDGKNLKLQKQQIKLLKALKQPTKIKKILNDVFDCKYADGDKIKKSARNRFDVAKSRLNT